MQMQKDRDGFKPIFSIGRLAESDRLPRNALLLLFLQTSSPGRDGMGSSEKRKKQINVLVLSHYRNIYALGWDDGSVLRGGCYKIIIKKDYIEI